jgi:histidyl-tRNA synthetase
VCAGGRYDGLFAQLGGKPAPACGFAMGVERLLALMGEAGQSGDRSAPDVYIAFSGEGTQVPAWRAAERLRDAGLDVILHCGGGSFKSQLKRADDSGARFAVIIGESEVAQGKVSLKPLRQIGEQALMPVEDAARLMRDARHEQGR